MSIARDGWESSDFPVVCETCLGPNPYVRMTKAPADSACRICNRPYTVFRWKPGHGMRHKRTEICQTCAKAKNVCQTCVLDLQHGLPVQVRDTLLSGGAGGGEDTSLAPVSDLNRNYQTLVQQRAVAEGRSGYGGLAVTGAGASDAALVSSAGAGAGAGAGTGAAQDTLARISRNDNRYMRNRPRVCTFWLKGECNRGEYCPFRHEMPDGDPKLKEQNIRDRYFGRNDPVANKILARVSEMSTLTPPDDPSIMTFFVGGVDESVTQQDLTDAFYAYGEIKHIYMMPKKRCAFVTYTTRAAAELAADRIGSKLAIKGAQCTVRWAKPQAKGSAPSLADVTDGRTSSSGGGGGGGASSSSTGGAGAGASGLWGAMPTLPPGALGYAGQSQ